MREIIQGLNKHTVAEATGISYSRLRKFSSGSIKELTSEEKQLIYDYLIETAEKIKLEIIIN